MLFRSERVDFVIIAGDLFHTAHILPRTFARAVETLQPLKDSGIPCVAVEGNHDWIHRRDNVSWMEALSQMGYIHLLRPERSFNGAYIFSPYDYSLGTGGHIETGGINIYGLGYIGAQAGNHVSRICEAVTTKNNILIFHVGIWTYSPVEIGNMKPEEAVQLSEKFDYVALGHGHRPYIVTDREGRPYAFNPGAPERVNFGEESYDKGYYMVSVEDGQYSHRFCPINPRPMLVMNINLDGAEDSGQAIELLRKQAGEVLSSRPEAAPLIEIRMIGKVRFRPFELGRERLRIIFNELCAPLHLEIKNHLSQISFKSGGESEKKSLAEIEKDVLHELISTRSEYKGQEDELVRLAMTIRDQVLKGDVDDEELLSLLEGV